MIRIPYEDGPRFNYREFDMMMSIATGRDNLIAGKTINTGIRNEITIFFEGIAMILLAVLLRILIPGADKLLGYVFIGFGVLLILVNLLLGALSVYSYRKTLQIGPIKSDIIFDESGLHSWESEERGFDADWENITHCFISKKWIYILFTNRRLVVDLPYTRETKEKVLAGLQQGYRLSTVKFLDINKGKITVRNK